MHQSTWTPAKTSTSTFFRASVPGRSVPTNQLCRAVSNSSLSWGWRIACNPSTRVLSQSICSCIAPISSVQNEYCTPPGRYTEFDWPIEMNAAGRDRISRRSSRCQ